MRQPELPCFGPVQAQENRILWMDKSTWVSAAAERRNKQFLQKLCDIRESQFLLEK